MQVKSSRPVAKSKEREILVSLVGRLEPESPPPDLSDKMLLTPSSESLKNKKLAVSNYLCLPLEMLSVTGKDCDMVGVG